MKQTDMMLIGLGGVALFFIVKGASAKGSSSLSQSSLNSNSHSLVQRTIDEILSDPRSLDHYNHIKTGGERGVPGTSKTVKPLVFQHAVTLANTRGGNLSNYGTWTDYTYAQLTTNENTTEGLDRDTRTQSTGIGSGAGAIAGTIVGGPVGTAVGGTVGGWIEGLFGGG